MKIVIFLILILFIFKTYAVENIKNNENHLYLLGKSGGIVKDYQYSNKDFNDYKDISSDLIFVGENQTTEFSKKGGSSLFYLDIVSNREFYIFVGNLEIGPLFEPESFQINSDTQFNFKLKVSGGGFVKVYISKLDEFNRDESLKFTDAKKSTGFITLDGPFQMSKKDQKLFDDADFNRVPKQSTQTPILETSTPIQTQTPSEIETSTPIQTQTPSEIETSTPSEIITKLPELIPSYSSSSHKPESEITESTQLSSEKSSDSSSEQWISDSSYSYNTIIIEDGESDAFLVQQIQQQLQQEQMEEEQRQIHQQQDTITTTVTTTQSSIDYKAKVSSSSSSSPSSTFGKIEDNSALVEQVFYKNNNNDANDLYEINKSNKLNSNSIVLLIISIIYFIL